MRIPGVQTNNNAEIFSTIKAIECVKAAGNVFYTLYETIITYLSWNVNWYLGLSKISIHTDSDFVIKGVNEWIPRWKTNGWKTSNGTVVKNKEMFEILHKSIQSMDSVSWVILIKLFYFYLNLINCFYFRLMYLVIKELLVMKRLISWPEWVLKNN